MTPKISVVICTIRRPIELKKALISIWQQSILPHEVLVVIGPDEESYEFIDELFLIGLSIRKIFIQQRNLSWARNIGLIYATGDYVIFLDDDAIAEPALISNYLRLIVQERKDLIGGFCRVGGYLNWQNQEQILNSNFEVRRPHPSEIPSGDQFFSPMGANFAVQRFKAISIDGFDNYLLWWGDEADFALRMSKQGTTTQFLSDAIVHHFQAKSDLRDENLLPKSQYIPWRSHAYLIAKHSLSLSQSSLYLSWKRLECKIGLKSLYTQRILSKKEFSNQLDELDSGIRHGYLHGISNRGQEISGITDVKLHYKREPDQIRFEHKDFGKRESYSSSVFIYREAKSDTSGGIANWIQDSAEAMAKRGQSVLVVSDGLSKWKTRVSYELGVWNIKVGREELFFHSSGITSMPQDLQLFGVAAKNLISRLDSGFKFSSIVVPVFEGVGSFFLSDNRLVTSLHTSTKESLEDHPLKPFSHDYVNRFNQIMAAEAIVLSSSPRILANSKSILSKLGLEKDERVVVIPHGIPGVREIGLADFSLNFIERKPLCTFLGRWEPRKGSMYLPSIIQTLLEGGVNVAVAGADPFSERESALRTIQKKYKGRIQIFGVLSEHQKAQLLRQTDVVMVPSIFESFGLIAAEALMSGAGVCAYSGSGVEEILTGAPNVAIVEKNSTGEFARAASDLSQTIFTDPEIKSLGKRFAEKNFSSDYIAEKLTEYLS